jgi:hypothetical protein
MAKKDLEQGVHYYLENGLLIFTEAYHIQRGFCCGNKCRHCPFEPAHEKGSRKLKTKA